MAALLLLGIPPDATRRVPARVAARVVEVARLTRNDVALLLAIEGDLKAGETDDRLPLDHYSEEAENAKKRARRRARRRT